MLLTFLIIIQCIVINTSLKMSEWHDHPEEPLSILINTIIEEIYLNIRECIVFISDPFYRQIIKYVRNKEELIPHYIISIRENDEFNPPRRRINAMLINSKNCGCNTYIILIANGLQVIELLQFAERERLMNTQGYFLLMHDDRIFNPDMRYIWDRIINVVFIHRLNSLSHRMGQIVNKQWFNLETISYPMQGSGFIITYYIDTWFKERFRNRNKHFQIKTMNLQRKKLKIAIFEHIPAVTVNSRKNYNTDKRYNNNEALGVEFEIIKIISKKINFRPVFYRPPNIEIEKWGGADENDTYNGLLREVVENNAALFLGDFHYTLRHYRLLELSYPYNTECLTFLTPESLTENSWKLLIIPFKLYTWIAVIFILFGATYILYILAIFYQKKMRLLQTMNESQLSNRSTILIERSKRLKNQKIIERQFEGLSQFAEVQNGILYTYGMLLQVSLPRLPKAWALRLFIGWWWLYCILVTVAYRASMTASLANPVARVTIDTLPQLAKSSIVVGGWGDDKRDLFISSFDKDMNKIGEKFEITDNDDNAIARVANGTFGYYENIYVLKEARAKRQLLEVEQMKKAIVRNEKVVVDRDLHIMKECVINMPISIGMNRNSPLKFHIDRFVRKIVESGLVNKWLNDVMEWSKIAEIRFESDGPKALVDIHKLYGALVALAIGYFLGFIALTVEIIYWKYIVMNNPAYDKYQMDIFYAKIKKSTM